MLACTRLCIPFLSLMPFCLYFRGIYREIYFLTIAALGKDHMKTGEGAGRGLKSLGIWGPVWEVGILMY